MKETITQLLAENKHLCIRLAEAEELLVEIAKGKCYCSQPAVISCYPCKARDFFATMPQDQGKFVLVRREDLKWIIDLTERKSIDAKHSPKFHRLKAVLGEKP